MDFDDVRAEIRGSNRYGRRRSHLKRQGGTGRRERCGDFVCDGWIIPSIYSILLLDMKAIRFTNEIHIEMRWRIQGFDVGWDIWRDHRDHRHIWFWAVFVFCAYAWTMAFLLRSDTVLNKCWNLWTYPGSVSRIASEGLLRLEVLGVLGGIQSWDWVLCRLGHKFCAEEEGKVKQKVHLFHRDWRRSFEYPQWC